MKKINFFVWLLLMGISPLFAEYSFNAFRKTIQDTLEEITVKTQTAASQAEVSDKAAELRGELKANFAGLNVQEQEDVAQSYQKLIEDFQNAVSQDVEAQALFDAILKIKESSTDTQDAILAIKTKLDAISDPTLGERVKKCVFFHVTAPQVGNCLDYLKAQFSGDISGKDMIFLIIGVESYLCFKGTNDLLAGVIVVSQFEEVKDNVSSVVIKQIEEANKPVVIDCFADWCQPCKIMKPIFEQLSEKYKDQYIFISVNTDEAFEFATKYSIAGLPTFLFIKDGNVVGQQVGALPAQDLENKINSVFA